MNDYLFLIRTEGNPMAQLSPEQMQGHLQDWTDWMTELATAGRLKSAKPLGERAACVRKDMVVDGPYAEAKDVVGGYLLVACESFDHAIESARECPSFALGSMIEIRETAPNVLE
ncbi:MAG: YciI family protein [Myxococcota bacterium]